MNISDPHYKVALSSITLNSGKTMPLLKVDIFGKPGLSEILDCMKKINLETENLTERYISVTDLSKLDINKFLASIILRTMESTYKSIISVKKPSIVSFVVLGNNDYHATTLVDTLEEVNQIKLEKNKDYQYRYVFVKSEGEVRDIASRLLH